jgi:hypothetical protein
MKTKNVLIIDCSKDRGLIIFDILNQAREICGYKKDVLERRLKGIKFLQEQQFLFMVKKIVLEELKPEIKEVLVCDNEKFKQYL